MTYYNYHAKVKHLITDGQLINYKIVKTYNGISPALVFFFKNHKPMPVRIHKWLEYFIFMKRLKNVK